MMQVWLNTLLMFGPPGSGKGTFSLYLMEKIKEAGFPVDLATMSELLELYYPEELRKCHASGDLLEDFYAIKSASRFISSITHNGYVIADGFCRRRNQAAQIICRNIYQGQQIFIDLDVPDEVCLQRMRSRALEQDRPDNNEDVYAKRLSIFRESADDIREVVRNLGVRIIRLDASVDGVENVFEELISQDNDLSEKLKNGLCV